jgi:hypothetical protein
MSYLPENFGAVVERTIPIEVAQKGDTGSGLTV